MSNLFHKSLDFVGVDSVGPVAPHLEVGADDPAAGVQVAVDVVQRHSRANQNGDFHRTADICIDGDTPGENQARKLPSQQILQQRRLLAGTDANISEKSESSPEKLTGFLTGEKWQKCHNLMENQIFIQNYDISEDYGKQNNVYADHSRHNVLP